MQGIPTQAAARLYDRLDQQAMQAQLGASKMKQVLAANMAIAPEGDKAYLQDLWNKVDGVLDTAIEQDNLPGHARQIRNLISDISGDPTYSAVLNNGKLVQEAQKTERQMAQQYGIENIVNAGDDASTFSTVGPNGQVRQFEGLVQRRPDYLKGMDEVFMRNTDIVSSMDALERFVYDDPNDPENGFGALTAYKNTDIGRIHVNDLSRQYFGSRFSDLGAGQQVEILSKMNDELYNAGLRFIKTKAATGGLTDQQKKDLQERGIISSGIANVSLTDGTEATDQTIAVFDDQIQNSVLDNQLQLMYQNDTEIPLYVNPGGDKQFSRQGAISKNQIKSTNLTSGIGPNGLPLIQVEYNSGGKDATTNIGYAEVAAEDLPFIQQHLAQTMYQLQNYSMPASVGSMAPAITNIYEPKFNLWAKGDGSTPYQAEMLGIQVKNENGVYALYDRNGNPSLGADNKPLRFSGKDAINQVRGVLGMALINKQ